MGKDKRPVAVVLENEEEESFKYLADAVTESLKEGCKSEMESFEVYTQKMRSHLHSDPQAFRTRFLRGYQVLLDELAKRSHKRSDQ